MSLEDMLKVAQEGAKRHNDGGTYALDGLLNFFCCFYGCAQFCKGADVWATEKRGMVPPPDFGERMSKDRFKRWMRYLSEGPENASTSDPWREVRSLIKGCNKNRKATIKPS